MEFNNKHISYCVILCVKEGTAYAASNFGVLPRRMLKLLRHFGVHRSRHLQAIHPKMATTLFAALKPPECLLDTGCENRRKEGRKEGRKVWGYISQNIQRVFTKLGIGDSYFESSS
jgi:hypothetical protein